MGWGHCGQDSRGRNIGYMYPAICDEKGCTEQIDRGLSYACGGMHGDDEISCEKYFCQKHKPNTVFHLGQFNNVCDECSFVLEETGEWIFSDEEGVYLQLPYNPTHYLITEDSAEIWMPDYRPEGQWVEVDRNQLSRMEFVKDLQLPGFSENQVKE